MKDKICYYNNIYFNRKYYYSTWKYISWIHLDSDIISFEWKKKNQRVVVVIFTQ